VFSGLNPRRLGVVLERDRRLEPPILDGVMTQRLVLHADSPLDVTTARHRLRIELDRWECEQVDDGLLVFTELVNNAVRHAGGATNIDVVHGEQVLRFEVHDRSHDVPSPLHVGGPSGGFGLRIVSNISDAWGWEQTASGKIVWCDVPCCPEPHDDTGAGPSVL
jgi:anti-sigma regulatory factor (Ser/Thr protein kinase)